MLVPGGFSLYEIMQNAATEAGDGTVINVGGTPDGAFTVLDMQVNGISGTEEITFKGTWDGTNYEVIMCENLGTGVFAATASADGVYRFIIGGCQSVMADITTYDAGTITITGIASA